MRPKCYTVHSSQAIWSSYHPYRHTTSTNQAGIRPRCEFRPICVDLMHVSVYNVFKSLQNYGDESDAYGLMYPSLYSNRGLYEQDFFMPRAPEQVHSNSLTCHISLDTASIIPSQIRGIFSTMGVPLTDDVFQLAWQKASGADPQGQVDCACLLITTPALLFRYSSRCVWSHFEPY